MDISIIKAEHTNGDIGIHVGSHEAKPTLEFMNLRCPYCRIWFEESRDFLNQAMNDGVVQRIIKLFDKEKPSLQRGNVMHRYVPRDNGKEAIQIIGRILETQDIWGDFSLEEVAQYAEQELGLTAYDTHEETRKIVEEANEANIQFVPTIIFGNEIFDESVTKEELKNLLY